MSTEFLSLAGENRLRVFNEIYLNTNINPIAVEKDWWVVQTLRLIFELDFADSLVFKGGTSLSKGWGIIERLSEDIDLALDRKFLGFTGEPGKNQVDKLRRVSHQFIREEFFPSPPNSPEYAVLSFPLL
jgi:predicted nucleotidyltransferase component of viral defense system